MAGFGVTPASFFQANRFLVPELVLAVMDAVVADGPVLDLYAGVGLFSVALAASGRRGMVAVEGDRLSGADLEWNARNVGLTEGAMTTALDSVERYLAARRSVVTARGRRRSSIRPAPGSRARRWRRSLKRAIPRMVYVSCDPATMARDARRLLDGGYRLESLRAFDLFPNTPHVEALGVFCCA